MTTTYLHHTCRACKGRLEEILNLGSHHLTRFPERLSELLALPKVPLILTACTECGLVQLDRTVNPDLLYRQYWYRSGTNETMVAELADVVRMAVEMRPVTSTDTVVDIGANDGTLLQQYPLQRRHPRRVAFEPASNLTTALIEHADELCAEYFPAGPLTHHYEGRCAIVTAIAMIYDLEDPVGFFTAARQLLTSDGILVVQFQDLAQQIQARAFDTICHEHLEYYTLWSLCRIAGEAGLRPIHVERRAVNGGSLRVVFQTSPASRMPYTPGTTALAAQFTLEAQQGLDLLTLRAHKWEAFDRFRRGVAEAVTQIRAALEPAFDQGRTVDVYGASTKGNITLQLLGLGPDRIRQAIDRAPGKVGRHTITGIPIVGDDHVGTTPADLWLANIWQFRESILQREAWYLQQGGTILFPLPYVELVRDSWRVPAEVA
jgi:NDP-4-keto-2,6-dideoxyhexose 3-C-methyltransferase